MSAVGLSSRQDAISDKASHQLETKRSPFALHRSPESREAKVPSPAECSSKLPLRQQPSRSWILTWHSPSFFKSGAQLASPSLRRYSGGSVWPTGWTHNPMTCPQSEPPFGRSSSLLQASVGTCVCLFKRRVRKFYVFQIWLGHQRASGLSQLLNTEASISVSRIQLCGNADRGASKSDHRPCCV